MTNIATVLLIACVASIAFGGSISKRRYRKDDLHDGIDKLEESIRVRGYGDGSEEEQIDKDDIKAKLEGIEETVNEEINSLLEELGGDESEDEGLGPDFARGKTDEGCNAGGRKYNGNCYYLNERDDTQWVAKDICFEHSLYLTTPADEDEQNFMLELADGKKGVWLDLTYNCYDYDEEIPDGEENYCYQSEILSWSKEDSWANWKGGKQPEYSQIRPDGDNPDLTFKCVAVNGQTKEWEIKDCSGNDEDQWYPSICRTE